MLCFRIDLVVMLMCEPGFTERGRPWEYSWDYKLFIRFVSHEQQA